MLPRRRRLWTAVVAVAVMVVAVAAMRKEEMPKHTYRITLGLQDKEPADWSGQVAVAAGEATGLSGWRFEDKDAVEGTTAWKCRTRSYIAPGERFPLTPPTGTKPKPPPMQPWPNGITLMMRGDAPTVTLTLPRGEVKFKTADVPLGEPKTFLDGQVRVERLPDTVLLRPAADAKAENPVQDDYPAFWVRYKSAKHYLSWVAYQKSKDRVLLVERDGPDGNWSAPLEVDGPGDHFRVALAGTHDDTVWIVWSSQRDRQWNLFGRPYKDGKLGAEVRLTEGAGPSLWHRMTTDGRGRAWLVWQSFRDGQSDVFARCADGDGWHDAVQVSTSKANDWDPTVAADTKEDRVWVGWDSYDKGHYGVRVRSLSGGPKPKLGDVLAPEDSPRFGAHVSLACDGDGRLWAAWDEAGQQWGKDSGYLYKDSSGNRLYHSRAVRIRCLADGKWLEPAAPFAAMLSSDMKEFNELPQLQYDNAGRMWLTFRHRTARIPRADDWAAQGRWDVFATAYLGNRWLPPIPLAETAGRNDMRASSQRDRDGNVYFACAADNRGWLRPSTLPQNLSISVSRLSHAAKPAVMQLVEPKSLLEAVRVVHPNEKEQVARIRGYKIEQSGKTYRIYRGDLHRHTDISNDGAGDGSLMDLHRYALDAAAMDFIHISDHNMGQDNEYCWWRTQKANDLYTVPGSFISMYGYERSVPYPNGHRNVIWLDRGHRTLPLPKPGIAGAMAADTGKLYANLRATEGICTLHTSATGQGTDWKEPIDPKLEPFVELFQGFHANFEAHDAPRAADEKTDLIHSSYKADGFVSSALAKGYRLGFQASSDHVSTHVSYACILAEELSRKGLMEAMRKRHAYAATDNIVLDMRMGTLGLMGDEVRTTKPRLDVVAIGTGPIDRVEVLRNGKVEHTGRPGKDPAEVRFRWDDPAPVKGDAPSYYYVRVIQKDGQMAWASPIWVQVTD
jgi:hypothetical protein